MSLEHGLTSITICRGYLLKNTPLSLVEYFEEQVQSLEAGAEMKFKRASLIQKLQTVFQENQQTVFLKALVSQGVNRLLPAS
jgi:hypothetical protein